MKEGWKEGRKEGKKEGGKEGREGRERESINIIINITQMATLYGPHCFRKNEAPIVCEKRWYYQSVCNKRLWLVNTSAKVVTL